MGAEACKIEGNSHLARGELDPAAECYRRAIAISPEYAEAHNNLGFVLHQLGSTEEAVAHLNEALRLNPRLANAYFNLGAIARTGDDLDGAIKNFRQALTLQPSMIPAYCEASSAMVAHREGEGARRLLQRGLALNPDDPDLLTALGNAYQQEANDNEALRCFLDASRLRPDDEEICVKLALMLRDQGRLSESAACLERTIALKPESATMLCHLGIVYDQQNRLAESIACYQKAISAYPDFLEAHNNLGMTLLRQDRQADAMDCFWRALAVRPECEPTLYNLAFAELAHGRLSDGWNHYDSRFFDGSTIIRRRFPHPSWEGESLGGKSLLIWGEQGVGDEILQAGLFQEMIDRTRRCVIECTPKLVPLFARSFPAAQVVPRSDPPHPATLTDIDYQCAAGSLGRWLRPSVASFPSHAGYLSPDPDRVAFWRSRLAALGPGLKVGFAWRSGNLSGERHLYCTTLDLWGPVFAVPNVHFINLQYDQCADELADARRRFGVPLQAFDEVDLFNDLAEAAALTQALDLVISAPTASSFLAGALGVPTWIMTYGIPWQTLGTDHLPWFPSMRLFSRRWDQPWNATIETLADELQAHRAGNA